MKILLVQTGFLGDTVLSTPVIAGIKKLYPQCELWMMTTPQARQIVERDPLLAGVITFEKRGAEGGLLGLWRKARALRALGFSRVYSLHRSFRTSLLLVLSRIPARIGFKDAKFSWAYTHRLPRDNGQHEVMRKLQLLTAEAELQSFATELRLYAPLPEHCTAQVQKFLADHQSYVVLVPGSVWQTKRWHWQGFHELARHFGVQGRKVVLLGSAEEAQLCAKVADGLSCLNLAGLTSISESMLIIKKAELLVCNDSVSLHFASAFQVPTVVVFCATSPAFGFGPWQERARIVEREGLKCKPCSPHGGRVCPLGTEACMREVSSEQVLRAVQSLEEEALSSNEDRSK